MASTGLGACASGGSGSSVAAASTSPTAITYVALGDSWPYGGHCGGCETFVDRYASGLQTALGRTVEFIDDTVDGGDTASMLTAITADVQVRADVASADVIVIATGPNDLDSSGALVALGDGTCGAGDACVDALLERWTGNFAAILDEVAALRGGAPTVLRMVTAQNIFVSDPSIAVDYHLPDGFALTTGIRIINGLTAITCAAAESHGGVCIDVAAMFNGPDGTIARDENTPESHQGVADALLATGTSELR